MAIRTVTDLVRSLPRFQNRPGISFKTEFRTFRFSYAQVYHQVFRQVNLLQQNGIKKGDRVMIWAPNSPNWIASFLAIASHGAIAVPMDFRATPDFVERVAYEAKPRMAFIGDRMPAINLRCKTIQLAPIWTDEPPKKKFALINAKPSDLLEIVYTSGTTGKPKGVILTNGNVFSNVNAASTEFSITPKDKTLSLLPLSHMFEQVGGFFVPLVHGAQIVHLERLNRRLMFEALERERPSIIPIVPRLLELIKSDIELEVKQQKRERVFAHLRSIARTLPCSARRLGFPALCKSFPMGSFRFFISGGAPLDVETERFFDDLGLLIFQGYGLTESSPVLTMNHPGARKIGSVGKPLPDVLIKIAKDGEILAKGPNITKGYYKNPKKTKELFVNGWLTTGDLGGFDEQGFLHIKGRKKDLIITSEGMNVYPEDIEQILKQIPGVKDSTVLGYPKTPQEQVHAVLLMDKSISSPKTIIEKANAKIPSYARITGFTVWPHPDFPRTSTMKVRKFKVLEFLDSKEGNNSRTQSQASAPLLYRLIAQVTKRPLSQIKPSANLTSDLGLASLDRVELLARIEDEMGVSFPDEIVTPSTTVKDLELQIEKKPKTPGSIKFRPWLLSWPIKFLRVFLFQNLIVFPATMIFTRPVVFGDNHLKGLKGPFLIVCNHTSHLDTPVLLMALPSRVRESVLPVAMYEYFKLKGDNPFKQFWLDRLYDLTGVAGNIIPFPQTAGFGQSMRYAGSLVDRGYSILVFPEGGRTTDGKIKVFKDGVGMMAVNYNIPILPVRVRGLFEILPRDSFWPKIGPSSISFGMPFMVSIKDHHEAAKEIERAVRSL